MKKLLFVGCIVICSVMAMYYISNEVTTKPNFFNRQNEDQKHLGFQMDKGRIEQKVHMKKLQEFERKKQTEQLRQYLNQLSTTELLEALEEYAQYCTETGESFEPFAFIEPILKAWSNEVPYEDIALLLEDEELDPKFKWLILDVARYPDNKFLVKAASTIAEDEKVDTNLRIKAIGWLAEPAYSSGTIRSQLLDIYTNPKTPDEVKKFTKKVLKIEN